MYIIAKAEDDEKGYRNRHETPKNKQCGAESRPHCLHSILLCLDGEMLLLATPVANGTVSRHKSIITSSRTLENALGKQKIKRENFIVDYLCPWLHICLSLMACLKVADHICSFSTSKNYCWGPLTTLRESQRGPHFAITKAPCPIFVPRCPNYRPIFWPAAPEFAPN